MFNSVEEVREVGRRLNYPILLKLDRGGGGKGIEKGELPEEIDEVFARVQRSGDMAFGYPDVYVEEAIVEPRHIEVQFIADRDGNVVCLGERECSIQRRHQKIIEESPSPVVTPAQRQQLSAYATKLAQGMGYVGAGTMEFLRSGHRQLLLHGSQCKAAGGAPGIRVRDRPGHRTVAAADRGG